MKGFLKSAPDGIGEGPGIYRQIRYVPYCTFLRQCDFRGPGAFPHHLLDKGENGHSTHPVQLVFMISLPILPLTLCPPASFPSSTPSITTPHSPTAHGRVGTTVPRAYL